MEESFWNSIAIGPAVSPVVIEGVTLKEIHNVHDIALPSILQSLQVGVGKNREGLLNANMTLSFKSLKILETGFVPQEERGEFSLWYIDDAILPNYLIHYERSKNRNKLGLIQDFPIYKQFLNKTSISILDETRKEFKIKRFEGLNPRARQLEGQGKYHLNWTIDLYSEQQSTLYMSGELNGSNRTFINKQVDFFRSANYNNFLYEIIEQVKPKHMVWNQRENCLEVPFGVLEEEDYIKMKTELNVPKLSSKTYGKFEETSILDIPIRPLTADDAKQWIMKLIRQFLASKFKGKEELRDFYISLMDSNTFRTHTHVFRELTIEYVLHQLRQETNKDAFWNLQAPMDLYMDLDQKFIVQNRRSDIKQGDRLSMKEFVEMIVETDQPDKLVFSSKYVRKDMQVKKFELFVEAFQQKGVKDILLVTTEKVKVKNTDILVETYEDVYAGVRAPHDRYFAFRTQGKWQLFKMSAELDQCRYSSGEVPTIQSLGLWSDISFMQIKMEAFPARLFEKLSVFEEVYQV
ncbi:hypothetical protein [Sutcliffiella horikoshii]|uniref:hypothetical protein n=1 Tax=Sutcliffiella horikoshii TaxID=79883 RepID=UPI00384F18EB